MITSGFGNGATAGDEHNGLVDTAEDLPAVGVHAGCDCPMCIGAGGDNHADGGVKGGVTGANPETGGIGQLLPLITNPDGSRSITGDRNVDAILIGSKWGTLNLTYSFPTSGSNYNGSGYDSNGVSLYHIDLGTQQKQAALSAFAQISGATNLTFTEIVETDTVHANIRISQSADNDVASAFGGFPSDTRGVAGDIWFGRTNQPYYDMAYKGTWGYATMLHEIGHTMGLKHGHQDYTNSDLSFYFGTFPRLGTRSLTPDRDGQAWSLMTYTPAPFTNSNFAGEKVNQPQTYMMYDLAALQYMYGANYNTNSSDSVYTFSLTTGEMFINGVGQGAPAGNKILLTIWDGGGNDTIDVSNYANGVTIDLRPGQYSTVDDSQLANHLAFQNQTALAPGNIAMSLLYNNDERSLIENAKGGNGDDVLVGNVADNILDGGAGSDTVIFTGATGVTVSLNDTNSDVIVTHDGETDTLRSIENIVGTSGDDTLTGNSQANLLAGGTGGADVLSGGAGDDILIGGGFTTTTTFAAPSQPDITKPQTTNNGSIATAVSTAGAFDVDSNPNIANSTTMPHATINATAAGGSVEYYRVDVNQAGAQAIFDIDGAGTLSDSIIELVNSSGVLLASNDTGPGDLGTTVNDDAYLTYTFGAAGTYYIRVGRWISGSTAQPLLAGQTYQLHISLQGVPGVTQTISAVNTSSAVMDGGTGNDFLQGTLGDDILNGGSNNDTVSFVNAFSGGSTTGVTVDLNIQGVAQNTVAAGSDTLLGIENVIGSALNDTLTGDSNDNIIEGGLGNDTLVGGGGVDTASFANATVGVTVSLAAQGGAQNTGVGTDTMSGFINLLGSDLADRLTGDAAANTLNGGAGDDILAPGENTVGAVDLLIGGEGNDTASFAGLGAVTAVLNGAIDGTATIGGSLVANLRGIENLIGGANADTLTGDASDNVIDGGAGNDTLEGGGGIDTISFANGGMSGITVDLATVTAQATGAGSKTITGFENVRGTSGADTIAGDGGNNVFFDAGGADIYDGAGGSDTVDYSAATSSVSVNLNTITAQNTGTFGGSDTLSNIENIIGSANFGNSLLGNASANRLVGGAIADALVGNDGSDHLVGGGGNDLLLGGRGTGTDDGTSDTVEGGAGNDFVSGGQGNDVLRGGDGDDTLVGGAGNTSGQYFTGVDGGDDTYDGGEGTDVAIMVYDTRVGVGGSLVGISFDIGNLAGNSDVTFDGVMVGSMTSIERITFRGTMVNDNVRGGGTLDSLTGGDGDDVLDGWYGNDLLSGGLGNDTLIGGEGLDTVTYATATAGVNVDLRITVAQDTGGEGIDVLSGIEYLTGSAFGDTLRGTDEFNLIIDSGVGTGATALSQTDSLFGYGGNDSLHVTRAAGAVATNINMDGGDGNDFIELRGGTLSSALAANAAGLSASGTGAAVTYMALGATSNDRNLDVVAVEGGAGDDRIILSGVASATINAGSGDDIVSISMRGGAGVNSHVISLGTGADIIQLGVGSSAGASTDVAVTARTNRVTDFEIGNSGDRFELTSYLNLGLTGYTVNSDAFNSGHLRLTQSGTDLLVQVDRDGSGATNSFVTVFAISNGYTGGFTAFNFDGMIGSLSLTGQGTFNETLTGATKGDTLNGGDGNDTLIGLSGNDTLDGGNGTDTATFSGNRGDYTLTVLQSGHLQVVDNRAGLNDGTDTLTNIEFLSFADGVISAVAALAPVLGGTGNTVSYTEQAPAVVINSAITLTDADSTDMVSATVSLGAGRQAGDVLNFTNQNGISGSYNPATGVLTLTGTSSLANYQAALRSVTFSNASNDNPTANGIAPTRTVSFEVNDGTASSATGTTTINVAAVNDAPSGANATITITEDGTQTLAAADFGYSDLDGNAFAGVVVTTLPGAGTLLLNGVAVAAGTFVSTADLAANLLVYKPAANGNGAGYASFTFQVQDDGGTANGGVNRDQSPNTLTFDVTAVNDTPVVDLDGAAVGVNYATTYNEGARNIAIGNGITVTDPDAGDLVVGGTVRIVNAAAGDQLTIEGSLPAGVTASTAMIAGDLVMTLSGMASAATYAAALNSIRYTSTSQSPAAGGATRTIEVQLNDTTGSGVASTTTVSINSVDNPSVAHPDSFNVVDGANLSGNVRSDNGSGPDSDVDGPVEAITRVNGAATVGTFVTLASGAQLRVNADGTFTYQTGTAFQSLAAPGSGATNTQATETFTYTLAGGSTATVTVQVTGADNADRLLGTNGADNLFGGIMDDVLIGGLGADTLRGGDGIDTVSYEDNWGAISLDLRTGMGYTNAAYNDTYESIENVRGSMYGDYIIGGYGNNVLEGGAGDDVLIGSLGADVLNGGDGIDFASYEDNQGAVFVYLPGNAGYGNAAQGDTFISIENLRGSMFDDYLFGDNGSNRLEGIAGNDVLIGGLGADVLAGGDGSDTASYEENWGMVNVDLLAGAGLWNAAAGDTYQSIENARGGLFNDTLTGSNGANRLMGGFGNDTLKGNGGADTFVFDSALDSINNVDQIVDFVSGTDKIELKASVFTGLAPGALTSSAFGTGNAATTADQRIVYDGSTGNLYYDADGVGGAAAVLFAKLNTMPAIAAADFHVVA